MTENVTFQTWLPFLVRFFTGGLDFSSWFCPIFEHWKTVNIFIIFTTFPGAVWDSTLHRSERLSFDELFFQQQRQRKHPLVSPSPLPPLTHPSAVPVSVLCGKQIAEHIQVKNS